MNTDKNRDESLRDRLPACRNIGLDLVHIPELERIMQKRPRFKERLFSEGEIRYCDARPRPGAHFAARFAAKEAYVKATGWRGPFRNIEVVSTPGGAPALRVAGADTPTPALSLTHSGDYAAAVVAAGR